MAPDHVKIVHTSDVHLDAYGSSSSPSGKQRRQLINQAFARVVDTAIAEQAHLFIIAGDLFDRPWPSDEAVAFAVEQLSRLSMPTVILPGNHDPYTSDSVYLRREFASIGPHIHIIQQAGGQLLTFPDLDLVVWGRPDTWQIPGYRPLEGIPPRDTYRWHVAVAHGHLLLPDRWGFTSYPIEVQELAGCGWDYVALGHWEQFADVSQGEVRACYSGSPMPLTAVVRDSGYVVLVDLVASAGVSIERRRVRP